MYKVLIFCALVAVASAGIIAPVPVVHTVHAAPVAVSHSSSIVHHSPVVHAVHAPLVHAPIVHAAPVVPVYRHAPLVAHGGVIAVHH